MNVGTCLCKQIKFAVDRFEAPIAHCHCKMCRKFHGAAFSTFVEVKRCNVHWLSGEHLLKNYRAENDTVRQFCQNCGASLTFESSYNRKDKTVEFALATFDDIENVKPDAHIYMASKVDWLDINDAVDKFTHYRNGEKWIE